MLRNTNEEHNQNLAVYHLPLEILLYILSFLDYETLSKMRKVARFLTPLATDDALWKEQIAIECPVLFLETKLKSQESYFNFFRRHFAPYHQTIVTLNYKGDAITMTFFIPAIVTGKSNRSECEYRAVKADDDIYPILKEGLHCTSRDSVIAFLKKIAANPNCLPLIELRIENNPLHRGFRKCSIQDMIEHAQKGNEKSAYCSIL